MNNCRVTEDLNRHQSKIESNDRLIEKYKSDFLLEELLENAELLEKNTEWTLEQCQAFIDMYNAMPMQDGLPLTNISHPYKSVWKFISSILNSQAIQDAADKYADKKLSEGV